MARKLNWVGSGCVAIAVFYACSSPAPSPPRAGGITGGATGSSAGGTGGASLGGAGSLGGSTVTGGFGGTGGVSAAGGAGGTGGKATGGGATGGAAGAAMGGTGGGFPMPLTQDLSGVDSGERGCNPMNGCAGGVNLGAQGTAYREQWLDVPISGYVGDSNQVESFTGCSGNPKFPDLPTRHDELQNGLAAHAYLDKNTPPDGDNYGERVRGYILAPTTGAYTFWLTSDNTSQLYISTTIPQCATPPCATPPFSVRTKARAVAVVDQWAAPGTFDQAGQKSQAVDMTAGSLYYFDLFYKEGAGGDHWEVRWTLPGQAGTFARVPASALYSVTPILGSGPAPCPQATGGASGTGGAAGGPSAGAGGI